MFGTGGRDRRKLSGLVIDLVDDTKELARAEVALVKAKVGARVSAYKAAIIFFAIAGVLGLIALIALVIGAILTLATLIGPGLATALVVIVLVVIAAVLAMIGKAKLNPVEGADA